MAGVYTNKKKARRVGGRKTYRKVITSPELTEKINPENISLMKRFLKNFSTKRSPKSVVTYKSNFIIFFTWNLLNNDNAFYIDIKKFHLMEFFDYCVTELKWSSNRFAQMHSCLSSFSTWIENIYDEKYPTFKNLLPKIEKLPKEVVRRKSVFDKDDLDKLMNFLGEKGRINEQCLLALVMSSGARVGELPSFTTDLIDENHTAFEGLFLETTEEIRVKGRGVNGKKIHRYIIKDMFLPYYKKWLPIRERIMREKGVEHNALFIKADGMPATESSIRYWMSTWDEALDLHWYPHSGRHFWTTYLLQIGLEKELVQELQNWSSDTLVDIYNDATAKDRKWKNLDKLKVALSPNEDDSGNTDVSNEADSSKGVMDNGEPKQITDNA